MATRRATTIVCAVVFGLVIAGCATDSDSSDTEATTLEAPIAAAPAEASAAPVSEGAVNLAFVEGRWQCDVQRQAFTDLAAMDTALNERLAAAGFTRDDYDAFKTEINHSEDLRNEIGEVFDAYCLQT